MLLLWNGPRWVRIALIVLTIVLFGLACFFNGLASSQLGRDTGELRVACHSQHRFINGSSIGIQIRWKFCLTLTSILLDSSQQILYMTRQLCCRVMCKRMLWVDGQQRNYSKAKFPLNLNCGQKTLVKRAPVVIIATFIMRSHLRKRFLQINSKSCTRRFDVRVPDLQMSCKL